MTGREAKGTQHLHLLWRGDSCGIVRHGLLPTCLPLGLVHPLAESGPRVSPPGSAECSVRITKATGRYLKRATRLGVAISSTMITWATGSSKIAPVGLNSGVSCHRVQG